MIRLNNKLFWRYQKKQTFLESIFLDWRGPEGWYVIYGKIFWGPYTEEEYSKLQRKQVKTPVYIGKYNLKYFWWYRDEFLICDEAFEEAVIVGWYVKRQASKRAKLEKYKELGKAVRNSSKSKSSPRKEKVINREALAIGLSKIGFKNAEAYKIICEINDEHPEATEEMLVKEAIKKLHKLKS